MNPIAVLFIILGILLMILAVKGSYSNVFGSLKKL